MTTTMGPSRRKREQLKRLGWLTEAQAVLGWGLILILVALLGAIYLNQASHIASVGRRVQVLQNELERLKRENALLARQIAEAQSLERLSQEAALLGFVPARTDDIEYLIVPDYPAAPAASFSGSDPGEPPVAESPATLREAIWLALKAGIGDFIYGEAGEQ
jgi:hypothetical protein